MIPELDVSRVCKWAEARTPPEFRAEMRVEVDHAPHALTVFEARPPWDGVGSEWTRVPVARLEHVDNSDEWVLLCADRNGRFRRYESIGPRSHVAELLDEIDADPTCIFWG